MSVSFLKIVKSASKSFVNCSRSCSRYIPNVDPLPTRYGGKTNITILPGIGIGPEIMERTLQVLKAAQAPLSYEVLTLTSEDDEEANDDFENALTSIRRNKVALKGNIETKSKDPYSPSRNIMLRKTLDLFAYVVSCKTYPSLRNRFGDIDVIVVRQNTEGEYLMLEHEPMPGTVEDLKIITRYASEKLAKFAFDFAVKHNRKLVTVCHNANVQRQSEGMFVEAAQKLSKEYPNIKLNVMEVGVLASKLVLNPKNFDVILATNLNGSMISNILSGMMGGPGLSAGTNFGENGIAVFEPGARNKGSSIVGTGTANPIAMINAAINLLKYLGYHKTSQMLQHSVYATLVHDKVLTRDLGGSSTTQEITTNVIRHVKKQLLPKVGYKKTRQNGRWKTYCPDPKHPENPENLKHPEQKKEK